MTDSSTAGQRAVRAGFNPSENPTVAQVKADAASLYDTILTHVAETPERTLALRHVQQASMFAVYALTGEPAETRGPRRPSPNTPLSLIHISEPTRPY